MKVIDSSRHPQSNEKQNEGGLKSRFSLKFNNQKYEKDYQNVVLSDVAHTLGINHRDKCKTYMMTYFIIVLLYNSSYISTHLEDHSSVELVLFQCVLLTSLTAVSSLILYNFLIRDIKSQYKSVLLIFTYLTSLIAISVNGPLARSKIFPGNERYGFSTVLGILPMLYVSKFTIFNNFIKYLIVNLLISAIHLIITLIAEESVQSTLIEFFFLISVTLIESHDFYQQELLIRDKFVGLYNFLNSDLRQEDPTPRTDIEEIASTLKESIKLIPLIAQSKDKKLVYAEKIFENLSKVMNLIGKRSSIYSLDIEGLDKNLDDEDKIFIEETCLQNPVRRLTKTPSKYLIRKTIEVIKNYQIEELVGILKRVGKEWNFDMFFLRDCTKNKALFTVGSYCMQKFHLDSVFQIESSLYSEFFTALENLYKLNPYHNSAHAADVLCSFMFLVNQSSFNDFIQDYEILAGVIAMLGHDVAHPGVTNRFLINTNHRLSITYNDYSVLEMMHCATTFETMQNPEKNLLKSLPRDTLQVVRGLIIDMILATDMAKHFDLIGKFKSKLSMSGVNLSLPEHRNEVLKIITKASDVGHAAKSASLHSKWTELVCEEFFSQGDQEKKLGLSVSMYCDREKTDLAKSQIGFIKNIVMPIYESLYLCFLSDQIKRCCVEQLEENIKMWETSGFKKRVMTLSIEPASEPNLKQRTETISGKNKSYKNLLANE